MDILGIDIGGSGIKGAVVDAETGELLTKRRRVDTPEPSTPQAVAVIFETLRRANAALDGGADDAEALAATVINLADALGVDVDPAGRSADAGDAAIEDLVARRQAAREAKDWATADALRDELSALGVVVEDTPAGPIWHRA